MTTAPSMRARSPLLWLSVWSVAFGVVEGAVVIYLRRLVYPDLPPEASLFPLRVMDAPLLFTEVVREAATMLMLLGIALVAERRPLRRFAVFAFCWGAWDIVYYVMLRTALGWPASPLAWDVLFLIPAPWVAPVLAPVLVSISLIAAAILILRRVDDDTASPFRVRDWVLAAGCGALVLASFFWQTGPAVRGELPGGYPWWLFLAGWLGGMQVFIARWRALARR